MLFQEIRHALRMLARSPSFTAVAVVSVALGIGVNSAIFSLHDALLWRPLPVRDAASVVTVTTESPDDPPSFNRGRISYPNYRDLRASSRSFDGLIAHQLVTVSFGRSREAVRDRRMGMLLSDNFFEVLGVQPMLGRRFTPDEGSVPGRDAVLMLGYDFWKNTLGGSRSIVGSVVQLNGIDFTVIGVTPASFTGMDVFIRPAFYVPLMMAARLGAARSPLDPLEDRKASAFVVKGRLKSGVSRAVAEGELATVWNELLKPYPDANRNRTIVLRSELAQRVRDSPGNAVLVSLMTGLVTVVLIIACANVANLMLGRARARSREIAIRLSLGVSRGRLIRQLLTESLLLALIGGAIGVGLAYVGIGFLTSTVQTIVQTDLPVVIAPQLDERVVLFSLLATVISAVLFGLAPALQSANTQLVPALKSAEPGRMTRHRTIGRNVLVCVQVALSMVLLVAAGMLMDGFRKSLGLDPGFRTDHLVTMSLDTSFVRYTSAQSRNFYTDLVDRARALPGVVSVSLTSAIPLDDDDEPGREAVAPEGFQFPRGQESASIRAAAVDERFFSTMRTAIVRGRAFTADDNEDARRVAIVNEAFARTYWPGQDPIGKRVRLIADGTWLEVVGVATTAKYASIAEAPTSFLYKPFAQDVRAAMSLLVETTSEDGSALAAPLRDLVRTLDVGQPVFNVRSFSSFYERTATGAQSMLMQAVTAMGLLGLTLALIGLYGLVAYSVARRTREIGLRMAVGASKADVVTMVLRQGLTLSGAGIVIGGVASVAVGSMLAAGMAGFGAPNPATYVVVPLLVLAMTLVASYIPARRASAVDPLRALRDE